MPSVVVPSLVLLRSKRILYDELRDRQQITVLDIAISCYHDPCETKDVSIDQHLCGTCRAKPNHGRWTEGRTRGD